MTYRVSGTAHGTTFDERGFASEREATDYASSIISGDVDATIEVENEGSAHRAGTSYFGEPHTFGARDCAACALAGLVADHYAGEHEDTRLGDCPACEEAFA